MEIDFTWVGVINRPFCVLCHCYSREDVDKYHAEIKYKVISDGLIATSQRAV